MFYVIDKNSVFYFCDYSIIQRQNEGLNSLIGLFDLYSLVSIKIMSEN